MHLVFLIHGLFGNSSHLKQLQTKIEQETDKSECLVYSAKSIPSLSTFDGIKLNSRRLYKELTNVLVEHQDKVTKISIIGYSMGGLCGRYLIGMLERDKLFDKIKPVCFATFATPHLGSKFVDGSVFGSIFNKLGPLLVGPTGLDLFRLNSVISDLADPDQEYFKGLARFEHRVLFCNAFNDRTVHFWTSFIADRNPFASNKHVRISTYENFPVFVNLEESKVHKHAQTQPSNTSNKWIVFLVPVFLFVLFIILVGLTTYAWLKRLFRYMFRIVPSGKKRGTRGSAKLFSGLSTTVDNAVSGENNQAYITKSEGQEELVKPALGDGYEGLVDSCQTVLKLGSKDRRDLTNLNSLSWNKYVVILPSMNTHAQIVDRRGETAAGEQVLKVFVKEFSKYI